MPPLDPLDQAMQEFNQLIATLTQVLKSDPAMDKKTISDLIDQLQDMKWKLYRGQ